jgi:hypothetical protein
VKNVLLGVLALAIAATLISVFALPGGWKLACIVTLLVALGAYAVYQGKRVLGARCLAVGAMLGAVFGAVAGGSGNVSAGIAWFMVLVFWLTPGIYTWWRRGGRAGLVMALAWPVYLLCMFAISSQDVGTGDRSSDVLARRILRAEQAAEAAAATASFIWVLNRFIYRFPILPRAMD